MEATPLDDVSFLARSPHRVEILTELAEGAKTRRELFESSDISNPTLGRILDDFHEKGWVTNGDGEHTLTPLGELLVDEFASLLEAVRVIQELTDVIDGLPLEEMTFGFDRLKTATIVKPTENDVLAHIRHAERAIKDADRVRYLSGSVFPDALEAQWERTVRADQASEAVIAADALDVVFSDSELSEWTRDLVDSDGSAVYEYDGSIPFMLGTADEAATIVPLGEDRVPSAIIESTDEEILEWVHSTIDEYRNRAKRITTDDFET